MRALETVQEFLSELAIKPDALMEKIIFSLKHLIVNVNYQQILQKFQTSDF